MEITKAPSLSSNEIPRDPFCLAYVVIPQGLDRNRFVEQCLAKQTIAVVDQNSNYYFDVAVTEQVIEKIVFPQDSQSIGSTVLLSFLPVFNLPIVTSTFQNNDVFVFRKENVKTIFESNGKKSASLSIDGDGAISLSVDGDDSEIDIKVNSGNKKSKLNVHIDGKIKFSSIDEFLVNCDKFVIDEGEQKMVLGNILKEIFDDFIGTVASSTVTTGIGQMPLLNKVKIEAFKQKTEKFLSEKGFLK